ncbi:nuclear transport factor 2 family protein [Kribbella speibonae]|uniref:Nuclear transport factor 2 family protein n=1 Tax=Kribbella speibonae TaxID=1572660 RepID=A0ABY2A1N0_9ACTN|nr:nuclear transport factor 2 family protein [Kribbella speibonae]TCC20813.1 nuclear transport factor 2 family protein [Kribbella speibonae]
MTVEDEVRAEAAASDAVLIGNDAELIASCWTDDWVAVDARGITPKADIIGWIASGRLRHHTMTIVGDERIARVGDTVVLTARKASSGHWDGTPYEIEEWISQVYVRLDGRWLQAFCHKS